MIVFAQNTGQRTGGVRQDVTFAVIMDAVLGDDGQILPRFAAIAGKNFPESKRLRADDHPYPTVAQFH